jgi:hypothetical protein
MRWLGFIAILLSGCSLQGSIGPQPIGPLVLPPGEKIVASPAGPVEVPDMQTPPIEVVEQGLRQAQAVRTMVRSLSR